MTPSSCSRGTGRWASSASWQVASPRRPVAPSLVLSNAVSPWRGSARSAGGVDVAAALEACARPPGTSRRPSRRRRLPRRRGTRPGAAVAARRLRCWPAGARTADRPSPSTSSRAHLRRITYSCASWHRWRTPPRRLRSSASRASSWFVLASRAVATPSSRCAEDETWSTASASVGPTSPSSSWRVSRSTSWRASASRTFAGLETLQLEVRDAAVSGTLSGLRAAAKAASRDAVMAASPAATGEPERPGVTGRPPVPPPGGGAYPPDRPPVGYGRVPTGKATGLPEPVYRPPYLPAQEPLPPRSRPPRNSPVLAPLLAFIGLLLVGAGSLAALTFLNVDLGQEEPVASRGTLPGGSRSLPGSRHRGRGDGQAGDRGAGSLGTPRYRGAAT